MKNYIILLLGIVLFSCNTKTKTTEETKPALTAEALALVERANNLAQNTIIVDTHVDLPYQLYKAYFADGTLENVSERTEGDIDYPRAKAGGLDAPFMSIYVSASFQETGGAKEHADSLIMLVEEIASTYPDKFALAINPKEVEENFKKGIISLPMGMENGAPIEDDLENVAYFYQKGIRYITLTHSKDNLICDSSYDSTRTWNGLSEFGAKVVEEMNKVGIMIDVSHISDSTFYQVMALSKAPVLASHSSCRHFTPDFERNMSDAMIKKLAEKEGVIQINFGSTFLDWKIQEKAKIWNTKLTNILDEKGLKREDSLAKPIIDAYKKENTFPYASVKTVADHIDHVVKLVGIDYVGIGSDYDGVGDSLPEGLKDVSGYPNLILELLKRGYSDEDIQKLCYKNTFRVWNAVEKVAGEM